jgi:hypothetical protein
MGISLPPPKCLAEVRTSPAAPPDILLDTLCDWPNRFFALACPCGEALFSATGEMSLNTLIDQLLIYGPLTIHCAACARSALVFDPRLHGLDAEIDHFPPTAIETPANRATFRCPTCRQTTFGLVARFEYPDNLLEALAAGVDPGHPTHVGREQDLFTWFTLVGRCSACHQLTTIASQECA